MIASGAFEDFDATGGDDLQAVRRCELELFGRASPHHTGQFARSVFECQVQVVAGVTIEVADLTDDVDRWRKGRFDRLFH